jgi:hypothetical protein
MLQKCLLDASVIRRGRWASIVLAFPKADGTFIDIERRREVLLCHAGKNPRSAQLPTSDEISASRHQRLHGQWSPAAANSLEPFETELLRAR